MMLEQTDTLAHQVETALGEIRHLLPPGFPADAAARRIAACYIDRADGTSAFWVARPRWTAGDGQATPRAVYEVLRCDGRVGVWDASTLGEGEVIADALTRLSW